MRPQRSRGDDFTFDELVSSMSRKQRAQLTAGLSKQVHSPGVAPAPLEFSTSAFGQQHGVENSTRGDALHVQSQSVELGVGPRWASRGWEGLGLFASLPVPGSAQWPAIRALQYCASDCKDRRIYYS